MNPGKNKIEGNNVDRLSCRRIVKSGRGNQNTVETSFLFAQKTALQKLRVEFGVQDIYRQVSFCLLNKQYQIILAEADLRSRISLPGSVHVRGGYTEETDFEPYNSEKLMDHGDFLFRLEPLRPIDNLFIIYSGSTMKTLVSNDSLLHYNISCSNLSIRYAADSPVDFFLSSGRDFNSSSSLNFDLILLRRNTKIYFLFILPIDNEVHVDPLFAGELLKV